MADINIERKKSSVLPWIIGLLVLAVVVWVVMQYFQGNDADSAGMSGDTATVQQPAPQYAPAPAPVTLDSGAAGGTTTGDTAGVSGTTTTGM